MIRIGELVIVEDRPAAQWRGREIALRPMEHRLLSHLAANTDRVHTRDGLFAELWGRDHMPEARTVDVHVARIRRALGEAGRALVTVRRVGYRLDPDRLP